MKQGGALGHGPTSPARPFLPGWVRYALCIALCAYPVIGIRHLPFGDSGRYMSVLAAPLSLLALLVWGRANLRQRLQEGLYAIAPFVPFALAYTLACVWHGQAMGWGSVVQRLGYGVLIVAAARMIALSRAQVLVAAALGCAAYFTSAVLDTTGLLQAFWPSPTAAVRYYAEDGQFRAGGGGGNPIHFADVAMWLLGLCICAAYFQTQQSARVRGVFALCAVLGLVACLASQSRGAMVALLVLYGVMVAFALRRSHRQSMALGLSVLLVVLGVAISQHWAGQRLLIAGEELDAYFTQPTFTFTSVGARLEMWRLAWQSLAHGWVFGPGVKSVADLMVLDPGGPSLPAAMLRQPHFHNDLVQSVGLGGMVLLLGHAATLVILLWQARRDAMRMWVVGAGIAFGLTDLVFHQNTMFTFMVSVWALLWATQERVHRVS